jgi:hypothetical protein
MDDDKVWVAFWVSLAVVLSVVFSGLFIMAAHNNSNNTERDKYYAGHCTVVRESIGDTGSYRDYKCKGE